ncbi:unnamed protein product [Phytophthora fragariaefolia]|uniref:Unnamed protein product n=1 Tax=Phytophthora fragariaefolia TaxID=1490495 RepID=A0A9W7CXU8_9STRA|nr:unnamed protein product [Phytophthora fragariaefolia]
MKIPEEVVVPLIKSQREVAEQSSAKHVAGSPNVALDVSPGLVVEFKLQRNYPSWITHGLRVRRTDSLWKQLDELTGTDDRTEDRVIDEVSSNQADSSISEEVDEVGPAQWLEVLRQQAAGMRALSARPGLVRGTFLDGMGGVTKPVYVTVAGLQEMDDEITDSM